MASLGRVDRFALFPISSFRRDTPQTRARPPAMRVTLRSLRIGWSAILDVPDKCLVGELRAEAAKAAGIEPAGRAKLVLRGAPLQARVPALFT